MFFKISLKWNPYTVNNLDDLVFQGSYNISYDPFLSSSLQPIQSYLVLSNPIYSHPILSTFITFHLGTSVHSHIWLTESKSLFKQK